MKEQIVKCTELNEQGYGVCFLQNRRYLVPNFLPGEEAKVSFFNNGFGKITEFIKQSSDRIKAKCARFHECGGCQLQHIPYEKQMNLKTSYVISSFQKVGMKDAIVLPVLGSKNEFNYRNKNQMVLSEKNKKVMSGFYEEFTHNLVNVDECVIQNKIANNIIRSAKQIMTKQHIVPFDEKSNQGLVKHILVRVSETTNQVLVCLVTKEEMFPGRNNFVKELRAAHPEITTIVQNINPRHTSILLGDLERVLYGPGYIKDELLDKTFMISSKTFYQVNSRQTATLYKKALEVAKPKKDEIMIDAYSGVGTIGILFAEHVKQVFAVESNKESVKNAIMNSKLNQVSNVRFVHADALDYMQSWVDEGNSPDILLVDPPRSGLTKPFMEKVLLMKPKKFVYISCNPETLASDVVELVKNGYTMHAVQPVDMFPQTNHVESVSLLSYSLP